MPAGSMSARKIASSAAVMRRERRHALVTWVTSFEPLEADVLESLGRSAVEVCCKPVVVTPGGEVAACDPGRGAVTGRSELCEARLGRGKLLLRLVEEVLLEQRAAEDEVCVSDLVEVILLALEELQRVPRLTRCLLDVAGAEVDLRQRGHG